MHGKHAHKLVANGCIKDMSPLHLRNGKRLAVSGVGAVFPTARNFQNFFPKPDVRRRTAKILRNTMFIGNVGEMPTLKPEIQTEAKKRGR